MSFSRALALSLAASLPLASACGGAAKPDPATPGQGATADGTRPEDIEPQGADNIPGDVANDGSPTTPGEPDTAGDATGDTAADAPEPEIKPPGVDLAPAEKARQVKAHVDRGQAALKGSSPDAKTAAAEAKAALDVDETSIPAMLLLAHALYIQGNYDKCEAVLDVAKARPGGAQSPELFFLYGLVYAHGERKKEAMAAYKQAVTLDPSYRSGLLNYGVFLIANKRWDEAVSVYEKLTGPLGVKTAAALNNLATAYRGKSSEYVGQNGNPQQRNAYLLKAKTTYERALQQDPAYARIYYNLGVLYLDAQSFPDGGHDMDTLARLKMAIDYFKKYQALPGANDKLAADNQAAAQKLYDREKKIRDLRKRQEARRHSGG
ncbi:MAG TPA: tetratricopeptide repeat protein [Kofleriaceae bacterium]|nr:tetratricopeptide repeat protein [Kofleriaceae bacterium]